MSQLDFYAILDECVSRLRLGEPLEACLADYPAHAAELAPDLTLTAELIHLPRLEPSPDAAADGYQKMLAALENQEKMSPLASLSGLMGKLVSPRQQRPRGLMATALRIAVIAVVVLAVAGSFVVTAAADTLPGDALYPLKRSWESARLTLTADDSSRQALQLEFEQRRREEVQAVLDLRRPVVVEFTGDIESLVAEVWQVDGLKLTITSETQVADVVEVGQSVTVRAQVKDDGSLDALAIVGEHTEPGSGAAPTFKPQPTQPALPTLNVVAPSPTPSPEATRPKPTATVKPIDRPTPEPTSTPAPSLDNNPTRDPRPTNTPSTNSLATSPPRPTRTPSKTNPTPTSRPVDVAPPTPTATTQSNQDLDPTRAPTPTSRPVDVAPPTLTATTQSNQDLDPTRAPTATRSKDSGSLNDHPP